MDLAPVVDVDTNPANPVIGARAFSSDPAAAGESGAAFIAAMQGAGVAACAKHYPGHGDTSVDSHVDLPTVGHSMARASRARAAVKPAMRRRRRPRDRRPCP